MVLQRDTSTSRALGKRGRPRKEPIAKTNTKTINKIMESINNHPGVPIMYASTTKGTMKLVVDGHHFRYSFRKGNYTIFQCCYKENKEECLVRVVTDQKLVYPLDGEHIHFIQATDKSVTSVKFALAGTEPDRELVTITDIQNVKSNKPDREQPTLSKAVSLKHENDSEVSEIQTKVINPTSSMKNESAQQQAPATVNIREFMPRPIVTNVKIENIPNQDLLEYSDELASETPTDDNAISTEEFREKIKKRLQKALLGKKK